MRSLAKVVLSASFLVAGLVQSAPVVAQSPEVPKCDAPYGTLALREPNHGNYWWHRYNLENPEALIKLYVNESGCFTMVDRGEGLDMRGTERDLADSGELQVQSNMGKGQLVAADFFLIPDLVTKDENSGGKGIAGAVGGRLGGRVGGLLGGLKTKKLEAETILTLVDARTGVQHMTVRGEAKKTNIKFGGGGLVGGIAAIGGGYSDTDIGRVIAEAYARAYTEMVAKAESGSVSLETAAPIEAYTIAVATEMYVGPKRGDAVRKLRSGMIVYPTGKREGAFLEAKDKFGTTGWVSVEDLQ